MEEKENTDTSNFKTPAWKKAAMPVVFIVLGIGIGFPLFSVSYYTMIRTSTPQFCASCHEIQFAYNT